MRANWFGLPLICGALCGITLTPLAARADEAEQAITKAIGYLQTKQENEGGYSKQYEGPGITSMVTTAILRSGRTTNDPQVSKALKFIEKYKHDDGGIYTTGRGVENYETSLVLMCLVEANKDHAYDKEIKKAQDYLKGLQWDESELKNPSDAFYGGAGYGHSKRPDLSNTAFLIDALKAAGDGPDDPALKKALVFVSRCQNLESPNNTLEFASKNPDGGFYYTPALGGQSEAGKSDDGGLRSYGSMTYSGLRSMVYAGVDASDPRVKAAEKWLGEHYDLKTNPGMPDGNAGLYYYYLTFAKALNALGSDTFTDAKGVKHNWREELQKEILSRQKADGSWVNSGSGRWLEGDANLVTGYALLALSYCQPKK